MTWNRKFRDCCYRPDGFKANSNNNNKEVLDKDSSPITEFYNSRSVFVTGGTGFLGKVLIEKLLRSCPEIKNIYILLRSKKGQTPKQRLETLQNSKVFERIRKEKSDALKKIVAIGGDICQAELGINNCDLEVLIKNVSIVFHSAATVKFDEPLRGAVEMNLLGTRRMVELCQKLPLLEALVHVSTAYANCGRTEIDEVVYTPSAAPQAIIDTVQWMNDDLLDIITPTLLGSLPNTYTFTKALAETLLLEEAGGLPVAVIRPSIVTAAWKEPFPGWTDNINGPTGLLTAISKGVIRSVLLDASCDADFIPVDIVIGLMLSVAWHTAIRKPNNLVVYNCTSGCMNTLSWALICDHSIPVIRKYPSMELFRIPGGSAKSSRFNHSLVVFFNHYVPAFLVDTACWIIGKKPKMVKLYQKVTKAFETLEYFTLHQWKFHCPNVLDLQEELSPADQKNFNFSVSRIDWHEYFESYIMGIRQYILKEDNDTLPAARRNLYRWQLVHRSVQFVLLLALWKTLISQSETAKSVWIFSVNYVIRLYHSLTSAPSI